MAAKLFALIKAKPATRKLGDPAVKYWQLGISDDGRKFDSDYTVVIVELYKDDELFLQFEDSPEVRKYIIERMTQVKSSSQRYVYLKESVTNETYKFTINQFSTDSDGYGWKIRSLDTRIAIHDQAIQGSAFNEYCELVLWRRPRAENVYDHRTLPRDVGFPYLSTKQSKAASMANKFYTQSEFPMLFKYKLNQFNQVIGIYGASNGVFYRFDNDSKNILETTEPVSRDSPALKWIFKRECFAEFVSKYCGYQRSHVDCMSFITLRMISLMHVTRHKGRNRTLKHGSEELQIGGGDGSNSNEIGSNIAMGRKKHRRLKPNDTNKTEFKSKSGTKLKSRKKESRNSQIGSGSESETESDSESSTNSNESSNSSLSGSMSDTEIIEKKSKMKHKQSIKIRSKSLDRSQSTNKKTIIISVKKKVVNLGEIEYKNPNYHEKKYIYPIGYCCETSVPEDKYKYTYVTTIHRGKNGPQYTIHRKKSKNDKNSKDSKDTKHSKHTKDKKHSKDSTDSKNNNKNDKNTNSDSDGDGIFPIEDATPSGAWRKLLDYIKPPNLNNNNKKKDGRNRPQGQYRMGLTSERVKQEIESLPHAEKCHNYIFKYNKKNKNIENSENSENSGNSNNNNSSM